MLLLLGLYQELQQNIYRFILARMRLLCIDIFLQFCRLFRYFCGWKFRSTLIKEISFINNKLTYIIDYIQYDNEKRIISANDKININYNNLCKEIIFVSQLDYIINGYMKDKFNYTSNIFDGTN